jgi:hypothetical protein
MCFRCSPFIWSIVLSCPVILRCSRVARCSGVSRCCGRFEVFSGIVLLGYFNLLLECPTAAWVLLHVWGYPHHTIFKTHLERNIIVVIEDSDIYTNFSCNYIIFLSYFVQTAETCGARHVVPTHPPPISPSNYHATTLPIYAPLFSIDDGGGGARPRQWRRGAVEVVRGGHKCEVRKVRGVRPRPPWSERLLRKFCFVQLLLFRFLA